MLCFTLITFWCLGSSSWQELQKERNSVTVQLDQSSRRVTQLEEEKKNADQSLKRTQGLVDDLKGKAEEMAAAIFSFHFIVEFTVWDMHVRVFLVCFQVNQKGRQESWRRFSLNWSGRLSLQPRSCSTWRKPWKMPKTKMKGHHCFHYWNTHNVYFSCYCYIFWNDFQRR